MSSRQARRTLVQLGARNATQRVLLANLRGYAQAAVVQDTKPPVALFGLDGTYASALVCERRTTNSRDAYSCAVVYCCG